MNLRRRDFLFAAAASLIASADMRAADTAPLRLAQTIPLPGVKGRFDHFAGDPAGHKLIVAALGNNTGEVLDVAAFKRLHTIAGLQKPQGALILSEPRRCYFANGGDGTLRAFADASYAPASQLGGLDDADNVRFDAAAKLIYVGYGAGALAVTDPVANRLLRTIPLPAHPESFQLEPNGPRIFVNVPDKQEVAVVDRGQGKVVARWPMGKWQANFPMALDPAGQRLFVGCRSPARLVVLDTAQGTPVADLEISGDTDDLFFDAKRQRLYISCGEGFIDVIQRRDPDHYARVTRIVTRAGARTSFFSPELDQLFLAVPERGGHEAELRVYQPE
jgi:DNA-binding beta-propeller fold protein YncE